MKRLKIVSILILAISTNLFSTEKNIGYASSAGRWIKIARIQNRLPIDGNEYSQFSGTLNIQTDFGQTGSAQYYAIFSFGSRGGIKPLLLEIGDAAYRSSTDLSRVEWRIYNIDGYLYLWMWQSNYSRYATFNYEITAGVEYWSIEEPPSDGLVWNSLDGERQNIKASFSNLNISGNVGIGTKNPDSELSVNGTIHTKEIKVDINGWSDFVFDEDYELKSIEEVEQYIKENGHLSEIPDQETVEKNGVNLGEMNAKLLQKIEELTLYTIQQQKRIEDLEKQNKEILKLVKSSL